MHTAETTKGTIARGQKASTVKPTPTKHDRSADKRLNRSHHRTQLLSAGKSSRIARLGP